MGALDPFYRVLDSVFAPIFNLTPENERLSLLIGIFFVSAVIALITTIATAKAIDQDEMKETKKKLKDLKEKVDEARKKGDEKKMKKTSEKMMAVQMEQSKNAFKPMIYTFPPIIVVFQWLRQYGPLQTFILDNNFLVSLPFTLPRYGDQLGWLGWYIVCSFMTSTVIRKVFKIQM
jgi:uncharacterized membrane protein (DUF106 family)